MSALPNSRLEEAAAGQHLADEFGYNPGTRLACQEEAFLNAAIGRSYRITWFNATLSGMLSAGATAGAARVPVDEFLTFCKALFGYCYIELDRAITVTTPIGQDEAFTETPLLRAHDFMREHGEDTSLLSVHTWIRDPQYQLLAYSELITVDPYPLARYTIDAHARVEL